MKNCLFVILAFVVMRVVFLTDIDCAKCAQKIVENVSFEKGVRGLDVNVDEKTVTIEYKADLTDTLKLGNAIRELGYEAKAVKLEHVVNNKKKK